MGGVGGLASIAKALSPSARMAFNLSCTAFTYSLLFSAFAPRSASGNGIPAAPSEGEIWVWVQVWVEVGVRVWVRVWVRVRVWVISVGVSVRVGVSVALRVGVGVRNNWRNPLRCRVLVMFRVYAYGWGYGRSREGLGATPTWPGRLGGGGCRSGVYVLGWIAIKLNASVDGVLHMQQSESHCMIMTEQKHRSRPGFLKIQCVFLRYNAPFRR